MKNLQVFAIVLLLANLCIGGVIRNDSNSKIKSDEEPLPKTATTTESSDEDSTVVLEAKNEQEPTTVLLPVQPVIAVTRDEGATIVIAKVAIDEEESKESIDEESKEEEKIKTNDEAIILEASIDPAPVPETLEDTEEEIEIISLPQSAALKTTTKKKSEALFLLDTPKIEAKKERAEEIIERESATEEAVTETTTVTTASSEDESQEATTQSTDATTKIDQKSTINPTRSPSVKITKEIVKEIPDNKSQATYFYQPESEYIVVESSDIGGGDVEQFATFTHAESEEHLQPIVQSVEIVPTYVDNPVIVDYYHHHGW